ncbi:metal-sulfur cluster assembly factor [Oryzibacter oryziterrae]|uniref:metal-sulfur cluster assembly factor n=1 Tax=Oryzibacter oryziterrae TaxID=2766474 RepID=UPI001F3C4FEF|nr:iron-sulfur cluster assembly protein [Oryzibacter oryziterrae]
MGESAVVDRVWQALRSIDDPELGVNIVDLGLVDEVAVDGKSIAVRLMMTTPTCPMAALMFEMARAAIEGAVGPGHEVAVTLDRNARWHPELAVEAVRDRFAPPPPSGDSLLDRAARLIGWR